ncbi:hypothetical protein FQZ97_1088580 [compost metagenome]
MGFTRLPYPVAMRSRRLRMRCSSDRKDISWIASSITRSLLQARMPMSRQHSGCWLSQGTSASPGTKSTSVLPFAWAEKCRIPRSRVAISPNHWQGSNWDNTATRPSTFTLLISSAPSSTQYRPLSVSPRWKSS